MGHLETWEGSVCVMCIVSFIKDITYSNEASDELSFHHDISIRGGGSLLIFGRKKLARMARTSTNNLGVVLSP